jgi:hypothetical protein
MSHHCLGWSQFSCGIVRVCLVLLSLICAALVFESRLVDAQTVVVQNDFEGGTHSLKTTGRSQGFHGPSLDIIRRS